MKLKLWLRAGVLLLFIFLLMSYWLIDDVRAQVDAIFVAFSSLNVSVVAEYIRGYGHQAMAVSFFLMVFQSIIAPLPAFLITFANAAIFGWVVGAILSWCSSMVGAALCFAIARIMGRDAVAKLTSRRALDSVDKFFDKYGAYSILICRLLPFVSFDIVSYAAGLTSMKFRTFMIATGVGQLPATLIYSYVGEMLTGGAQMFMIGLSVVFSLSILIYVLKSKYSK